MGLAAIVFVALATIVSGLFFTYEVGRAVLFGVVLGSAKRHEPPHDVFLAKEPVNFYGNVALYALFDIPFLLFAIALIVALIRKATRTTRP